MKMLKRLWCALRGHQWGYPWLNLQTGRGGDNRMCLRCKIVQVYDLKNQEWWENGEWL